MTPSNPDFTPPRERPIALVIGASGSFGGHAVAALLRHGWRVRALARDPAAASAKAGPAMPVDWVRGDAMITADVVAAADGVAVVVHAANPPAYRNWRGLAIPMLAASIEAARVHGARIVFPGTVYNYAPDAGPRISETAPQAPVTRKGKIRVEMEDMLRDAAARFGVRALILRAGDFIGPAAGNSCLNWLTMRRGGRLRSLMLPGPASVGHAYAYLPDLTEVLARLLDREADLAAVETFHFTGYWLTGAELAAAVRRAAGNPKLPVRPFPHLIVQALSPFNETFRELIEMRYLWERPIGLDDARLRAFLGGVPATPLDTALRETLSDLGCRIAGTPDPNPYNVNERHLGERLSHPAPRRDSLPVG